LRRGDACVPCLAFSDPTEDRGDELDHLRLIVEEFGILENRVEVNALGEKLDVGEVDLGSAIRVI
jgi:hypothetical protein